MSNKHEELEKSLIEQIATASVEELDKTMTMIENYLGKTKEEILNENCAKTVGS